MDRHGVVDPHSHVGWWPDAAGAEGDAQNRTHIFHHLQQDGHSGLLPDAGAVPDQAEEGEIQLQAMLPEQVCVLAAERMKGKEDLCWFKRLFLYFFCSLKGPGHVECKFYNELGRILVKDFAPASQMNEIPGDLDDDFSAYSTHETGKHSYSLYWLQGAQESSLDEVFWL